MHRTFAASVLALVLTGCPSEQPLPPQVQPPPPPAPQPVDQVVVFPEVSARLMITNGTDAARLFRIRALLPDVNVDCAAVAEDPTHRLSAALFGPAQAWVLEPGRAIRALPHGVNGSCAVALIDGADLPKRLVFFPANAWPAGQLSTDAAAVPPERALVVRGSAEGPVWGDHPALFGVGESTEAGVECRTPDPGTGIEWAPAPVGTVGLFGIQVGADGCHALDLEVGEAAHRWFVCAGGVELPFATDDTLTVRALAHGAAGGWLHGVEISGAGGTVTLIRGTDLPPGIGGWTLRTVEGCGGHTDACGSFVRAAEVQVEAEGDRVWLAAGDTVALDAHRTLSVHRVQTAAAVRQGCMDHGVAGQPTFEAVHVERTPAIEPGDGPPPDDPEG